MKTKKILALVLGAMLLIAGSIAGTVAYLTDEDSDTNVMTLGNVDIDQLEYERAADADGEYLTTVSGRGEGYLLQDFTQNKPLYPATGAVTGWDDTYVWLDQIEDGKANGGQMVLDGINNVQDKFVVVKNTGKSDAYVRTIMAFEMGSLTEAEWDEIIMLNINDQFWTWNWIGATEIDGNNYMLAEVIYAGNDTRHPGGVLAAGEYTYNSLSQIYMIPATTNEDVEAIDGDADGTYDILVFSQAVQTNGFDSAEEALDEAFGDITAVNHPWAA